MLEYRKRQREARRSGSKTECCSPVSTVLPLAVEAFPVALEPASEPPPPCSAAAVKEPQASEEAEASGEKEGGEGQWYVPSVWSHCYWMSFSFILTELVPDVHPQDVVDLSGAGQRARLPQSAAAQQR